MGKPEKYITYSLGNDESLISAIKYDIIDALFTLNKKKDIFLLLLTRCFLVWMLDVSYIYFLQDGVSIIRVYITTNFFIIIQIQHVILIPISCSLVYRSWSWQTASCSSHQSHLHHLAGRGVCSPWNPSPQTEELESQNTWPPEGEHYQQHK